MGSERVVGIVCLAVGLVGLGGCTVERTVADQSMVELHADSELDFWDAVAERPVVTNNDALHGLILVLDPEVVFASYEERLDFARSRGWIGAKAAPPRDESATLGLIAVAVCDLIEVRGGVNLWLFGPTQRYCTRELIYLELIPRRTENQSLSGLEFVDLIGRVEDEFGPA